MMSRSKSAYTPNRPTCDAASLDWALWWSMADSEDAGIPLFRPVQKIPPRSLCHGLWQKLGGTAYCKAAFLQDVGGGGIVLGGSGVKRPRC